MNNTLTRVSDDEFMINGSICNGNDILQNISSGLEYIHTRVTHNTRKTLGSSAFLYALIELLDEKGILSIAELEERKKSVAQRLVEQFERSRIGLLYQDPEEDKYTFDKHPDIDCRGCLLTCKAICCKIPFALSRQDVEESVVRWEFGRPYLIAHDDDGYCVHLDRNNYQCSVYQHRPVPCRGFSCLENKKWPVWNSFDDKNLNPDFEKNVLESNRKMYRTLNP